jgi:hypothetical protein
MGVCAERTAPGAAAKAVTSHAYMSERPYRRIRSLSPGVKAAILTPQVEGRGSKVLSFKVLKF